MNLQTYSTVCTICASPLLWSLVDLDVLDDEIAGIKALGVCIGLRILEKPEEEVGGLDGPATLGGTKRLCLSAATGATSVPPHWNCLLVLLHILEEGHSALQLPAVDYLSRFAGVLERYPEVRAASSSRLLGRDRGCCVPDHCGC